MCMELGDDCAAFQEGEDKIWRYGSEANLPSHARTASKQNKVKNFFVKKHIANYSMNEEKVKKKKKKLIHFGQMILLILFILILEPHSEF